MLHNLNEISKRDRAVLIGLFLSRFDKQALECFGFTGFRQAYNVMGLSIGFIPNSIKNYRDEFDPYFPNERKGWRNRSLRNYCKDYLEMTADMSFEEFRNVVTFFLEGGIIDERDIVKERKSISREFTANRLITGKAAEEYFVQNYISIDSFRNYSLMNTTQLGCGFDFKLSLNDSHFYVEVKGLNEKTGSILMTDKEYSVADDLRDLYCLYIVSNFRENPEPKLFFNPLYSPLLDFKKQEQVVTRVSYSAKII